MQATDCRRAFPCFDEPDFKAVVRDHARRRRRPDWRSPTVPRSRGPIAANGRVAVRVRGHDADEHVPRRRHRRPAGGDRADRRRRASPLRIVHVPGKGNLDRLRARGRRREPGVVPAVLRHPLSGREGRHDRPARLRRRGDGELRLHHLSRVAAARRSRLRARSSSSKSSPM